MAAQGKLGADEGVVKTEREGVTERLRVGARVDPIGDKEEAGLTDGGTTTTPPKLNPSDMEFTDQVDPLNLKAQGSAQGATCRSTGHVHVNAVCTWAHLTEVAPVCVTTMAYRVGAAGMVKGVSSVIVTIAVGYAVVTVTVFVSDVLIIVVGKKGLMLDVE